MTVADVAGRLAGAHCCAPAPKNRACGSVPETSLTAAAMPIPLEELLAVTSATSAVRESLSSGRPQRA